MAYSLKETLGLEYKWEEIERARKLKRLLTLDIELSRRCNFKCAYCYSEADTVSPLSNELSLKEICDIIIEGHNLGAKRLIIVGGGEPLIYPKLKDVIDLSVDRGLSVNIFTNGTGIDKQMANFLFSRKVGVILKLNSRIPEVQNKLCGVNNAFNIISNALNNLVTAGYTQKRYMLGIATVICEDNYNEIIDIWLWARKNNIIPYVETMTPQGRANSQKVKIDTLKLKDTFNKLKKIDEDQYGLKWKYCNPPLAGNSCLRHFYSCYIRADGVVQPCSGIDIAVGNARESSLGEILNESKVLSELRNIDTLVKGKCSSCEIKPECYGCRGVAYQMTGDYLEGDPLCWYNC